MDERLPRLLLYLSSEEEKEDILALIKRVDERLPRLLYLSGEEEKEDILALIKLVDERLPRTYCSCSIQLQVAVSLEKTYSRHNLNLNMCNLSSNMFASHCIEKLL